MTPDQKLYSDLNSARSTNQILKALKSYYVACDSEANGYTESYNPKIDCCAGCNYCCHFRVSVQPNEVFLIMFFIERNFNLDEKNELLNRLDAHHERVSGMSVDDQVKSNIQCPLLVDGKCSVYEMRPLSCRGFHSSNVDDCKASHDDPTDANKHIAQDIGLSRLWSMMGNGCAPVLSRLGYDITSYELGTALREVMQDRSSLKRWKKKKKAFIEAKKT